MADDGWDTFCVTDIRQTHEQSYLVDTSWFAATRVLRGNYKLDYTRRARWPLQRPIALSIATMQYSKGV